MSVVAKNRLVGGWRRVSDLVVNPGCWRDERRVEVTIRPDEVSAEDGGFLFWNIPLPRVEVIAGLDTLLVDLF